MNIDPSHVLNRLHAACRINVTGNVGVGKSTVTRELSELTNLPCVHMDHIIWMPGWHKRHEHERQSLIEMAIAAEL